MDASDSMSRKRRLGLRLHRALFILPNLFTLASVFCGFYAIIRSVGATGPDDLYYACLAVLVAMGFDAADGRIARLTRTQSDMGIQMDSLADLVSFGVAPAMIVY